LAHGTTCAHTCCPNTAYDADASNFFNILHATSNVAATTGKPIGIHAIDADGLPTTDNTVYGLELWDIVPICSIHVWIFNRSLSINGGGAQSNYDLSI
jgi:hypothetical protein